MAGLTGITQQQKDEALFKQHWRRGMIFAGVNMQHKHAMLHPAAVVLKTALGRKSTKMQHEVRCKL